MAGAELIEPGYHMENGQAKQNQTKSVIIMWSLTHEI